MNASPSTVLSSAQLGAVNRTDPKVYEWRARVENPNWIEVGVQFITYLAGPVVAMLAVMIVGAIAVLIWRPLGVVLVVLIFAVCFIGGLLTGPFARTKYGGHVAANFFWLGSCAYGVLILTPLNPASNGFSTPLAGVTVEDALAFWFENVLTVLLFDMPDVIGWSISELEPVSKWARAEVVGLRLLIGLGMLELVIQAVRRQFSEHTFHGTVQDCLIEFDSLPYEVIVTRVGTIIADPAPLQVRAADLVAYLKGDEPRLP